MTTQVGASGLQNIEDLPEKQLRFLFDFNDGGKKGYLTKQELYNLMERLRKRDRIQHPLPTEAFDSVCFLLDPSQQNKISWEIFLEKFNVLFWRNRRELYAMNQSTHAHKESLGVFVKQVSSPSLSFSEVVIPKQIQTYPAVPMSDSEDANQQIPKIIQKNSFSQNLQPPMSFSEQLSIRNTTTTAKEDNTVRKPPPEKNARVSDTLKFPPIKSKSILDSFRSIQGKSKEMDFNVENFSFKKQSGLSHTSIYDKDNQPVVVGSFVMCPYCHRKIYMGEHHQDKKPLKSYSTGVPSLNPKTGEFGRMVGIIPSSFLTSSYNFHKWALPYKGNTSQPNLFLVG